MASASWEVRSFRPGDGPVMREIAVRSFDGGDLRDWSRLDVEQLLGAMPGDPEGIVVGSDGGAVVGFIWPHQEQLFVHPGRRRRGYGSRLVQAGLERVRRHGEPVLSVAVPDGPAALPFAERLGFAYASSLCLLRLPTEREVAAPAFPPEVVTGPVPADLDVAGYVTLINRSFANHPSPLQVTEAMIQAAHGSPGFDPEDVLIVAPADAPGRPVGFCRTRVMSDEGTLVGEIALVGVLPEWRGRGLGRELLRWGVAHLRGRGVERLTLTVEARNERALGLYERTGFVRVREWPRWAKSAS